MKDCWPELVVQTLAAINARWWGFSIGDGLSAGGSLFDGGSNSTADSTVGFIFWPRPR